MRNNIRILTFDCIYLIYLIFLFSLGLPIFKPVVRIRIRWIRNILASWIRNLQIILIHGSGPRSKISTKNAIIKLFLSKPKYELLKKERYQKSFSLKITKKRRKIILNSSSVKKNLSWTRIHFFSVDHGSGTASKLYGS